MNNNLFAFPIVHLTEQNRKETIHSHLIFHGMFRVRLSYVFFIFLVFFTLKTNGCRPPLPCKDGICITSTEVSSTTTSKPPLYFTGES